MNTYKSKLRANKANYRTTACPYKTTHDVKVPIKQFPTVNRENMFRGKRYNNQELPNILHGKVLETYISILVAQINTIQ